ncbi:MAG: hypothetical protein ACI4Q4_04820, partial [Oscillospiraceae bacterium]
MKYSEGSASSLLVGLYTMVVEFSGKTTLAMEPEVLAELGLDTEASPEETYTRWISLVHEDDREFILSAVQSCIAGLQAEVKFRWE